MSLATEEAPSKRGSQTESANPNNKKRRMGAESSGGPSTSAAQNGVAALRLSAWPLGRAGLIDRTEYVRLLEQSLQNLGFHRAAAALETESGVVKESAHVGALQAAVLAGDWPAALHMLEQVGLEPEKLRKAMFLVSQQRFLEVLDQQDLAGALRCLRADIAPLGVEPALVHRLAACLMCSSPGELHTFSGWAGGVAETRAAVLRSLQLMIPPEMMLPDSRLEVLVEQAIASQVSRCPYHNTARARVSLLQDYSCTRREQLPTHTVQVLLDHTDEVWQVAYSHDGSMLASACKDATAIVWDVGPGGRVARRHVLRGHLDAITNLAWSPDDFKLATCSNDKTLRVWDVLNGACLHTLRHHTGVVNCAAWMPDGKSIVTGGLKEMHWVTLDNRKLHSWGHGVQEVAVVKGNRYILSSARQKKVRIYDLVEQTEHTIPETDNVISLCVSRDQRFLLTIVDAPMQNIRLWDLGRGTELQLFSAPLQRYTSPVERQNRFVVRGCFGGLGDAFVLSGSEEHTVYVWHRDTGELLAMLEGHSGTVNAAAWNPANPQQFCTASDDKSIRIWGMQDENAKAHVLSSK